MRHTVGALDFRASFTLQQARGALWGPSGAGKSTLLRVISGLLRPREGTVRVGERVLLDRGKDIDVPAGARGTAFLTQTPALFPRMSVERNLRFGLRALPVAEQGRRVDELVALFGLETLLDRFPARLSGGERQRVALARALAPRPELVLLDEPFSALDGERKAEVWQVLDRWLTAQGAAMLLVSHDPAEVWAHAETVVRMVDGKTGEQGPPSQLLAREREAVLRQLGAV